MDRKLIGYSAVYWYDADEADYFIPYDSGKHSGRVWPSLEEAAAAATGWNNVRFVAVYEFGSAPEGT